MTRPPSWFQAFRARRKAARYYPAPARLRRLSAWLASKAPLATTTLQVALTLVGIAHVAVFALLPGGLNPLFGLRAPTELGYLTLTPVGDTLGFYGVPNVDGFIMYKVYTEGGTTLQGTFPDPAIYPRLRYDRWAKAGQVASGNRSDLHASILRFVLHRLPGTPLKIEMYAARWDSANGNGAASTAASQADTSQLVLRYLGTHDGITRAWQPAVLGAKR